MPLLINEGENAEFKQIMLLATNALWIVLSNFYFDRSWPIKFSIVRMIYFLIFGICRTETSFLNDPSQNIDAPEDRLDIPLCGAFTKDQVKSIKVFVTDMLCWSLLSWAFGLAFLPDYGWAIFQAGFCLSFLTLPERVYMPQSTWIMQASLRT